MTTFSEANDVLSVDVDVHATRAGSIQCGPASGTATLSVDYAMLPANLTSDP